MNRYKLKTTTTNLSRNANMYTAEQLDYMKAELADMIRFWKYDKSGEDGNVQTNFFDTVAADETNPEMNFIFYNYTKTLPQCGQLAMRGPQAYYHFG